MFCEECGHNNRNDSKFCNNCGATLLDYTKKVKKEELVMPEEVKTEKVNIEKNNILKRILNITMLALLGMAILFTILSFAIPKALMVLISLSMVFYGLLLAVWIFTKIYFRERKKKNKKAE